MGKLRTRPENSRWLIWAGLFFLAAAFGGRWMILNRSYGFDNENAASMAVAAGVIIAGVCWISYLGKRKK